MENSIEFFLAYHLGLAHSPHNLALHSTVVSRLTMDSSVVDLLATIKQN